MSDIIYDKPHRRKKEEVRELSDVDYIAGLASSDSIVLDNSVYGDIGICRMHFGWLCRHFHASEKFTRALIVELTWSTNEMKIVEEAKLS